MERKKEKLEAEREASGGRRGPPNSCWCGHFGLTVETGSKPTLFSGLDR